MLWRLNLQCLQAQAESFCEVLEPYVLAVSWYEANEEGSIWVVEATCKHKPDLTLFTDLIAQVAKKMAVAMPEITIEEVPETDWLEQTWRNFPRKQLVHSIFMARIHANPPQKR